MTIHLATDHAGFAHKEALKQYLVAQGVEVIDHGATAFVHDDDYPDFIIPAAEAVANSPDTLGVIFGYSGQGEAMVANRIKGVRAAVYYGGPTDIVTLSKEHNAANILSIGAHFVSEQEMFTAVMLWFNSTFTNDVRHVRRLAKF